jgi:hypothetical protein
MATTRKKPAAATKAAAAPKPAKKAGAPAPDEQALGASSGAATAVAEPPAKSAAPKPVAPRTETKVEAKGGGPAGVERRRTPREKMVAPAVLQPSSGDASVDRGVQVQDLSLGGVGFVASEKFDPGEIYRITLGKGPLLLNARVRIVSCNKTGHRMYRCGAEFC